MTDRTTDTQSPQSRIVRAATELLAHGGRKAVTTRAVSAAAGVQAPTIYRQFGDMRGLLDAVARETLATYVREKAVRARTDDPVADLRTGWDLHVAFGLANPDAYALLFGDPSIAAADSSATREAYALLEHLVGRVAEAGRLRVSVAHATRLVHAAGNGVTLTLIATPPAERDPKLSDAMREAILAAVTVAPQPKDATLGRKLTRDRVAMYAVALRAALDGAAEVLSPGEQHLFRELLDRLAGVTAVRTGDDRAADERRRKGSAAVEPRGRR